MRNAVLIKKKKEKKVVNLSAVLEQCRKDVEAMKLKNANCFSLMASRCGPLQGPTPAVVPDVGDVTVCVCGMTNNRTKVMCSQCHTMIAKEFWETVKASELVLPSENENDVRAVVKQEIKELSLVQLDQVFERKVVKTVMKREKSKKMWVEKGKPAVVTMERGVTVPALEFVVNVEKECGKCGEKDLMKFGVKQLKRDFPTCLSCTSQEWCKECGVKILKVGKRARDLCDRCVMLTDAEKQLQKRRVTKQPELVPGPERQLPCEENVVIWGSAVSEYLLPVEVKGDERVVEEKYLPPVVRREKERKVLEYLPPVRVTGDEGTLKKYVPLLVKQEKKRKKREKERVRVWRVKKEAQGISRSQVVTRPQRKPVMGRLIEDGGDGHHVNDVPPQSPEIPVDDDEENINSLIELMIDNFEYDAGARTQYQFNDDEVEEGELKMGGMEEGIDAPDWKKYDEEGVLPVYIITLPPEVYGVIGCDEEEYSVGRPRGDKTFSGKVRVRKRQRICDARSGVVRKNALINGRDVRTAQVVESERVGDLVDDEDMNYGNVPTVHYG